MAFLRPDGDSSVGSWSDEGSATTNIYQSVDETSASDTDYAQSSDAPSSDTWTVTLSNPTVGVDTGSAVQIKYRIAASDGGSVNLDVALKQGATTIASWSETSLSSTASTITRTLTTGEKAAVSDWDALTLEFTADTPSSSAAAWLSGSDAFGFSTMYEETTPVTEVTVSSAVGYAEEQVGTNHLTQSTASLKPVIGGTEGAYEVGFDGSSYMTASGLSEISKSNDWTFEAIVKDTSLTSDRENCIFQNSQGSADRISVNIRSGYVNFGIYNGSSWSEVSSDSALTIDTYYRVSAVLDGGTMKLYIDGVEQSNTTGDRYAGPGTGFYLGAQSQDAPASFVGEISDVRVWSDVRSQAEIDAEKDARLAGTETNLVAYWPL